MDKRWIGILLILIVGCCSMYFIVESSTTIGNAITVVNKTVVSVPNGFSIDDTGNDFAKLVNDNTGEKISFEDLGKKDIASDTFNEKLNELKGSSQVNVLENSTINIKNMTVYRIDYQNLTTENTTNISICYVYTCYHTFAIQFKNYKDTSSLDKDMNYSISNMKADFKQYQD